MYNIYIYINVYTHKNTHMQEFCILVFPFGFVQLLGHLCSRAMKRKPASGQVAKESIELKVSLPSGRRETVAVPKSGTIADLKIAGQQSFRQPFLRLAAPDGCLLDPTDSLCGFQDGDSFTAVAQQPKIAATRVAFALWCAGGNRIITWGHPNYGDSLTALESEIGSGMCSRSVAQHELLLQFWQIELW